MPESSTTPPARAVFLSYAREDVEQARRIADALRAFGMEVWFDQAELRGGDAWDQKIRRQIRDCSLFMPLISARTQERGEGYFRREWNLGVERTRDMAHGVPFIVPVVVDDTPADEAMVPEEFMRYQWTHLKHGVPSSQFVEQVKSLLEAPRKSPGSRALASPSKAAAGAPAPAVHRSHTPLVVLGCFAVLVAGVVAYLLLKPRRSPEEVARLVAAATTIASQATSAAEKADAAGESGPSPAAAPAVSDKSIAVLPFENMSEDKDTNAFFADGIHEDILTNLALVKGLRVVSRTSVMQYRGTTKPIREIARELGVAYILEGSVRRAGSKVRVTGQLIHAATDEHIWAKSYDRDVTDIFAIQGELAQAIAGGAERRHLARGEGAP
jgi:TolB-like protein